MAGLKRSSKAVFSTDVIRSRVQVTERNQFIWRLIAETIPMRSDNRKRNLVEMNWDPITRIVGSLGIFTKIDFENKEVAECYSTSSIFRGYSIFMKGKDPRDAHFITSRICGICGDNHATCACYAQNMRLAQTRRPHGRVDHQPWRSRRVHV